MNTTMPDGLMNRSLSLVVQCIFAAAILITLYLISLQNYLLFHGIVEIAGITVAFSIFILIWNTRKVITDVFFLIVGISFLFTGSIDLIHTLAYKGMGVFAGNSSDLPTQLWIAARYFQSITFLIASLFIGKSITKDRNYDIGIILAACAGFFGLLLASIFIWHNFPSCFVEGSGLTPFKIVSEYIISLILIATVVVLVVKRQSFEKGVWQLLVAAQVFLILGELAFTSYISVYGFMNMLGHLFRLISVYLFYRAFVVVGLTRPYDLLFRELKQNETALRTLSRDLRAIIDNAPAMIFYKDTKNNFLRINPAGALAFGKSIEEIEGKSAYTLFPDRAEKYYEDDLEVIHSGKSKFGIIERMTTSRGEDLWVQTDKVPTRDEHDTIDGVLVFAVDITERKRAEDEIQLLNATLEERVRDRTRELEQATETISASLDEKIVLLREVHHRVKNNLQIIISLVSLQMRQTEDPGVKQIMSETQNRVRAMSLVHEKLYRSDSLSHIDFADYTRFLATQLFSFYGTDTRRVQLDFAMEKILLDINTAVPLGLLMNELISNSLKHAFPDGRNGTISISGRYEGNLIILVVRDNGIGIPKDFDWKSTTSLGMQLVTSLVDQVDGTITLDRSSGTVFTISVKVKE